MSVNLQVKSKHKDHREIFAKRLGGLINREYGEKRGSRKKFYDDFYMVLKENDMGNENNGIDEAGKKWVTGQTIPSTEKLELLAGFFNVSIDYLLGKTDIESSTDENYIREYIGLEPHATRILREYYSNGYQWQLNTIDAINFLLERRTTANLLLNMYYFFFGNYAHTRNKEGVIEIFDADDCGGIALEVPKMQQPLFMSYVMNGLTEAYKDYVKDNPQYKDYGKPTRKNLVLRQLDSYVGTKKEKLEKFKADMEKEILLWKNKINAIKGKNTPTIIESYTNFLNTSLEIKKIVEDMILHYEE